MRLENPLYFVYILCASFLFYPFSGIHSRSNIDEGIQFLKTENEKKTVLDHKFFRTRLSASLCFASAQHHDSVHSVRSQNFPVDDYVKNNPIIENHKILLIS